MSNQLFEESKQVFKSKTQTSVVDDSKPFSEINIQANENHQVEEPTNEQRLLTEIENILKNRRKYQVSWVHKILTLAPSCLWKSSRLKKNKAMYIEGEDKYHKDLDCVSIIKSIRELKAMTRILLSEQQRQLLAFERESILPSSKLIELQESKFIQNKVPFENWKSIDDSDYWNQLSLFIEEYKNQELEPLDTKIMNEIINEDYNSKHDQLNLSLAVYQDREHQNKVIPKFSKF